MSGHVPNNRRVGSRYGRNKGAPWITKHALDRASQRLLELWLKDHPKREHGLNWWLTHRSALAAAILRGQSPGRGLHIIRHDGVQFLFDTAVIDGNDWKVVTVARAEDHDISWTPGGPAQ